MTDPAALAAAVTTSYLNAQQLLGAPADQLVRMPTKPDDEAGWAALHKRMGKPDKAEDYILKTADGKDLDAPLADALRAAAFKNGSPKKTNRYTAVKNVRRLYNFPLGFCGNIHTRLPLLSTVAT